MRHYLIRIDKPGRYQYRYGKGIGPREACQDAWGEIYDSPSSLARYVEIPGLAGTRYQMISSIIYGTKKAEWKPIPPKGRE